MRVIKSGNVLNNNGLLPLFLKKNSRSGKPGYKLVELERALLGHEYLFPPVGPGIVHNGNVVRVPTGMNRDREKVPSSRAKWFRFIFAI